MRLSPDDIWADMMSLRFLYLITQTVSNITKKTKYLDKIPAVLILMNVSKYNTFPASPPTLSQPVACLPSFPGLAEKYSVSQTCTTQADGLVCLKIRDEGRLED